MPRATNAILHVIIKANMFQVGRAEGLWTVRLPSQHVYFAVNILKLGGLSI